MTNDSLDQAVGLMLRRISYVGLPWDQEPKDSSLVDVVSRAVLLDFGLTSLQIGWYLRPPIERLAVAQQESWEGASLTTVHDVSGRWRRLIGKQLRAYRFGMQDVESGLEPWAVLLEFGGDVKLFVALGEMTAGHPTYLHDSLVVTAEPDIARAYIPIASMSSAWP